MVDSMLRRSREQQIKVRSKRVVERCRDLYLKMVVVVFCLEFGRMGAGVEAEKMERFEFERPQMGVPFRIVIYAEDATKAKAASEAAFARVERLNEILSDYEYDSELSALSRASGSGQAVRVSAELWAVLERAQELAGRTEGAFDVTVGPVVNLWRRARRVRMLPEPERLAEARQRVGYRHVVLDKSTRSVLLGVSEMRLDLGGIAKGYAADEALRVLEEHGITRALVAAAGDIRVSGPPPGKNGWLVGVAGLDVPGAPSIPPVELRDGAISTSGDLSQRLEIGGRRYSHIVDPRTGIGLLDHSVVSVIARDSMTADSLATAVSVLGPEEGLKLIESTPGTAVRIVRMPEGKMEVHESSGWPRPVDRLKVQP